MIYLYQPPAPKWDRVANISPFCLKLEAWLRLTRTPYKLKKPNLRKAPKGKIPWIVDDQHGVTMGDSGLIIEYLKKTYNIWIDARLTPEQQAISLLLQRTLEEHFYFGALAMRWGDEESFAVVRAYFIKVLPPMVGRFAINGIRKSILKSARAQGMGRHSREDLEALCRADLDAVAAILGDKPFVHGDAPTTIDATLYGFMANLIWVPWDCNLKKYALSLGNIVAHCERMHKLFVENK